MSVEHRWPVTNYSVTMEHRAFGWIELKDGDQIAGYIYFTDETPPPSDFVDIGDMLIDYSGEPPRFVRDVLDPAQVHGGYQYQPPQP